MFGYIRNSWHGLKKVSDIRYWHIGHRIKGFYCKMIVLAPKMEAMITTGANKRNTMPSFWEGCSFRMHSRSAADQCDVLSYEITVTAKVTDTHPDLMSLIRNPAGPSVPMAPSSDSCPKSIEFAHLPLCLASFHPRARSSHSHYTIARRGFVNYSKLI